MARFSDEDVVSENFQEKVRDVMRVMVPFVHMCVISPC